MSLRYKGGVISATPPTTSTTSASGNWTLEQQMQAQGAGTWPFGGPFVYIEDVFSTYLYTGTSAAQTITNGINLSTYGGLVWIKSRSTTYNNYLQDTTRGIQNTLVSNDTSAQSVGNDIVDSVSTSGFVASLYNGGNASGQTYASWTFRKQAKFFDVVTYTGNGTDDRAIAHSLGSVPGCYIVKAISTTSDWLVYHRGNPFAPGEGLRLNGTNSTTSVYSPANIAPTSTNFYAGRSGGGPTNNGNINGVQYVAYLFAHNAGGFGLTGSDNVISCGSYLGNGVSTGVGQGFQVTLGWEPQFVMIKRATGGSGSWWIGDNMRGLFGNGANGQALQADTSAAEQTYGVATPNATGFTIDQSDSGVNASGSTYIYIAIRRGPMKTPTSGTSVFIPSTASSGTQITTGFNPDLWIGGATAGDGGSAAQITMDRLRGGQYLGTTSTNAEGSTNNPFTTGPSNTFTNNVQGSARAEWLFGRAPGFFDVVCYTGTGVNGQTYSHNLGVTPEMMIVKRRESAGFEWDVWHKDLPTPTTAYLWLNSTAAVANSSSEFGALPTASVFSVGNSSRTNAGTSATYVNYLFATVAGVSKVGSYTGTGALQTINCGFTSGARWVMIKRTDSTGSWYVYDSARGITSGNDPYLLLNSTAAQVTNTNYVDTDTTGFKVTTAAPAGLNANGGTYIFLAIA